MATLIFSPFCVPDVEGLRRLHALPLDLADDEVAEFAWQRSRAAGRGDVLFPWLQRVVSIACIHHEAGRFGLFSLSGDEVSILQRFYALADATDFCVSWGVPGHPSLEAGHVLQSRAVLHQIAARSKPVYQCLSAAVACNSGCPDKGRGLEEMTVLAGLPGGQTLLARDCWGYVLRGDLAQIEALNESRVLAQHIFWLRQRLLRGELSQPDCLEEYATLRQMLQSAEAPHLQAWLAAWSSLS